jgi:uracil-DNA glycosylase
MEAETMDPAQAHALLDWQVELGADECIGEHPVNRYEMAAPDAAKPVAAIAAPMPVTAPESAADPVVEARTLAASAATLDALADAQAGFEHCELKRGARNFVFADGRPGARVMILGEAPGRDEDMQGRPFVGRAGQLLDRMFAAIGMARDHADAEHGLYISNILPWRPPQNRDPSAQEMAMMLPFVARHVELADPEVLILMGNTPCGAILNRRGITRIRGQWAAALDRPVLPMLHPAYLLRNPAAKREAWADLLTLQARLRERP